jgi:hypothetical protein
VRATLLGGGNWKAASLGKIAEVFDAPHEITKSLDTYVVSQLQYRFALEPTKNYSLSGDCFGA